MSKSSKNLLVTGAAGFIGSNFCRYMLKERPEYRVIALDALTYAGNLMTLSDIYSNPSYCARFKFYPGRIQDETVIRGIIECEQIDLIVNFAAESHNDRSLLDPGSFIQTDVYGVFVLLDTAHKQNVERILHVSTDEVCGTVLEGQFTEQSPLLPNTPYSASKAGGELQARAHHIAYGTPVLITRCGNNFGPYQYPEKLLPFFLTRLIDDKKVPLYGDGSQVRDWVFVMDHCSGIDAVLHSGVPGEIYNIGCDCELPNIEVVRRVLRLLKKPDNLIKHIPDPRGKSHDQRYSIDASKLRSLGWKPAFDFESALEETVRWYQNNETWWRTITARPDYQEFIQKFYGPSLGADL